MRPAVIVDELVARLGYEVTGEADLKKFTNGLDRAESHAQNFATAFGKIGLAITGAFAGLAVGAKLGDFVGDITRTNAQFEKYEATLKVIEGSAAKAEAAMGWIKEFGASTPYEVGELTDAFVKMRSYGLDPMDGSFKALGDASSAMGKSFMSAVEALADASTGESERLKEFGITAKTTGDQITYSWQENGKDQTKTVKKTSKAMTAAVVGIMKRFDGAMIEQNKTWDGTVSNLSDRWTNFLLEIGDAGYYTDIKRRLQSVLDVADQWAKDGSTKAFAESISRGLIAAMNTTTHLATQAFRVGKGFYYAADALLDITSRVTGLSKGMSAAGIGIGVLASSALGRSAILAIAKRVPWVAAAFALDDIMSGLNGDASMIGSTPEGQASLDNLKAKFGDVKSSVDQLITSISTLRSRVTEGFNLPEMPDFGPKIEGMLGRPQQAIERAFLSFKQLATDPGAFAMDLMRTSVDNLAMAFENAASLFRMLASPIESIKTAIAAVQQALDGLRAYLPEGAEARSQRIGSMLNPGPAPGQTAAGKGGRIGTDPSDRVAGAFGATSGGTSDVNSAALLQGLQNIQAHMQAMGGDSAAQSIQTTVTNTDNRQFPFSQVINVGGVSVAGAAAAPAAVGSAVGQAAAAAGAKAPMLARRQSDPGAAP